MRLIAACALTALLGATATYAANNPGSETQSASTTAATTKSAHPKTSEACEKEAVAKKLYGKEHDDYVKECQAGKKH